MERIIYLLKSIAEISTHTKVIFVGVAGCIVVFYECENSRHYTPQPQPYPYYDPNPPKPTPVDDTNNPWIPPKPNPNPTPIMKDINISGIWNDETGGFSQFTQNGSAISYENYNLLGQKVGYGNGEISGNEVELVGIENSTGFNVELSVKLNLSKNGQRLSGTISSTILGLSFPLNLTKR